MIQLPSDYKPRPDPYAIVKRYTGRALDRLIGAVWCLFTLVGAGSSIIGLFNFVLGLGAWVWWKNNRVRGDVQVWRVLVFTGMTFCTVLSFIRLSYQNWTYYFFKVLKPSRNLLDFLITQVKGIYKMKFTLHHETCTRSGQYLLQGLSQDLLWINVQLLAVASSLVLFWGSG